MAIYKLEGIEFRLTDVDLETRRRYAPERVPELLAAAAVFQDLRPDALDRDWEKKVHGRPTSQLYDNYDARLVNDDYQWTLEGGECVPLPDPNDITGARVFGARVWETWPRDIDASLSMVAYTYHEAYRQDERNSESLLGIFVLQQAATLGEFVPADTYRLTGEHDRSFEEDEFDFLRSLVLDDGLSKLPIRLPASEPYPMDED